MKLIPAGSRPSKQGNRAYFTGRVRLDPVMVPEAPARAGALMVTFEPGARTAWHTHPLGQTIHVVSGLGRCQSDGGPLHEIRPGDTVWFAPGERHWHGAAPDCAMVHLAIQEEVEGTAADWLEQVSDAEYLGRVQPR